MKCFLIMFLLIFMNGCSNVDKYKDEHIIPKVKEVQVYSKTYLYDIFEYKNVEIITKNELLDTINIGKKSYQIEYIYDKKKYTYNLEYNITDNEAPRYFGGTNKQIEKNYNGDLCNLVMYGDNYDGHLFCEVIGDYDLSTVGTYKVTYKITDKSHNETNINVTLNVVEEIKKNKTNTSEKKEFTDILNNYKNEFTEVGIDVSKWQGEIDFEKVKNAGASFVMIRMGFQSSVGKNLSIDPYYEENIKKAKDAGLKVGVYLYSIATSKKEAKEQAKWVLDTLNNEKLDLPIVFDWENWSKWNTYNLSFYEINDIANKFIETINKNGYVGMLYGSKYYLENIWTNENDYPVWLAHYTDKTSYKKDYMMWQLSNTGKIDGIKGDVDINVLYNNKEVR